MGYRRSKTIYKLVFTDEEYDGLIVRAYAPPVKFLTDLTRLASLSSKEGTSLDADDLEQVAGLFDGFAKCLADWNLEEEDGTPVPATLDGIQSQDFDFMLSIINTWIETTAGVSAPKGQPLNDGSQFPVASIPMETLSPSPSS